MLDRRLLLQAALACAAATLTLAPHAFAQTASVGAVETLRGTANASREGQTRQLAQGGPVFLADQVKTDANARLALKLGQRTLVRLGEKASLRIEQYLVDAGGDIALDDGSILFERSGPPSKAPINVRSPYGLISVRGTTFFAGPSNGVFGVFVQTGRVVVTGGGRSVTLAAGQGTDIARPGARPTPPKTWGPPRIDAALRSVR
jgi:ferric-dicitrate binding protein FerR (iron transport regulator)